MHMTWHGDLGTDDLIQMMQTITVHEADNPIAFDRLHDLRAAGALNVDFNAIMHIVHNRRAYRKSLGDPFRVAFVVVQQAHYGLVRIYQQMMDNDDVGVEIFDDFASATAWLDTPAE
jgi:hypothetical protein